MKQLLFSILLLFSLLPSCKAVSIRAYSIAAGLKNAKTGDKIYLQAYHGKTLTSIDSLSFSNNEQAFHGTVSLGAGMYALSLNKTLMANFFVSDENSQNFTISLDIQNPAQTLSFVGSPENQAFIGYLRFLGTKQHSQEEINLKGGQLQKQFTKSMLALFIQTMREPEIIEPASQVTNPQEYAYRYLANHFFDNVDFSDKRLLNTPLLEQKLGAYFRQMVAPLPDSIIGRVELVLERARAGSEVYNWVTRYLYDLFREAPFQGNIEVCNFIGKNYILPEPNRWNDSGFVEKVHNRILKSGLNPVGSKTTNLKLEAPDGEPVDLYSVKAKYTVLFFFNPGCDACRPVSEALSEFYRQYKNKSVEVFAVYVGQNKEEWSDYIETRKLVWINGYDPSGEGTIYEKYDLYAIPMIYLLDKDKNILAKDVLVKQLGQYLK